jgi:peptidoglycan/xylan/chitin deacetylase (PgdA/CDA1 family)
MKRSVQNLVRRLHLSFARRALPDRVAVYFHALEAQHWEQFSACVMALRQVGYRFVGPDEFVAPGTGRLAHLSFDDNYRSWYEALSLLDRLDVRVTFYLNTLPTAEASQDSVVTEFYDRIAHQGDRTPLSRAEIRALGNTGHIVGNHSHSHRTLSQLSLSEATHDIRLANDFLAEFTGEIPKHFSYPFGMRRHFSARLRAECIGMGFATIANAIPGLQYRGHRPDSINRTLWRFEHSVEVNMMNLRIDGRAFEWLTGRSAIP